MHRTSSATLEFSEDTLVLLSFHFLFMSEPTSACPLLASECYSRWPFWRVVKLSSFRRTSPSPITSHFMLFSFSSSSSPLVWWFVLTQRFLPPPVCSLGGREPPPTSQTSMLMGTGGLGLFVLCMLVFMAYPSMLANALSCVIIGSTPMPQRPNRDRFRVGDGVHDNYTFQCGLVGSFTYSDIYTR